MTSATQYLETLHTFLQHPAQVDLERDLGASWVVLARNPDDLGTSLSYADPAARFAKRAGLTNVWSDGGVRILTTPDRPTRSIRSGRRLHARDSSPLSWLSSR